MRQLLAGVVFVACVVVPTLAAAEPSADVKVGTGVEGHKPTGVATSFKKGDMVYAWAEVVEGEGSVQQVWKRDDKEFKRATLPVKGKKWTVFSFYRNAVPGKYVVEVLAGERKLGEAAFSVE